MTCPTEPVVYLWGNPVVLGEYTLPDPTVYVDGVLMRVSDLTPQWFLQDQERKRLERKQPKRGICARIARWFT